MGKVEFDIFGMSQLIYLDCFAKKCSLNSPLCFILILSKLLNSICCQSEQSVKFCKIWKYFFSKTMTDMKLTLCMHDIDISTNINCVFVSIR